MSLEITHLVGGYAGFTVIKDLNLNIAPGETLGLIGLNGAGKSTTIKHILGLLPTRQGRIALNERTLADDPTAFKRQLAYIPETPILYPELTLKEHLQLTMLSYGLAEAEAWPKAQNLLTQFRLADKLDWLPSHFSKGMQQKVMIVCAFLADTPLLIIDEPFTGLDPLAVTRLIALIEVAKAAGKMILMTTHVLAQAQRVISKYAVLNQGIIAVVGSLAEIRKHYGLAPTDSFDLLYEQLSQEQMHG